MKIKTSELEGIALDWAVAQIEKPKLSQASWGYHKRLGHLVSPHGQVYCPSSNWSQGGPIIEREWIIIEPTDSGWAACKVIPDVKGGKNYTFYKGDSPLIAAMRCYVASKLGEEVEVPNELMGD